MKIICDYCKNTIDIDKDNKCPNCMASYADNKMFKERIEKLKEEKELELETRRIHNETAQRVLDATKNFKIHQKFAFIFILAVFIIIVTIIILTFIIGSNIIK